MEREKLIQLVTAAQSGNAGALDTLFNQFYNDVYYFALKTVKDEELACDITQETFVEIINTINNLQEPAAFVKWMKQITYHQCTRYFKKKKDVLVDEDEDGNTVFDILTEERAEFIPEEAIDQKDFRNTILAMLDELSEEQRAATLLYYYDELSVKQIAQIQGVSEGTVKSRLNYARKSLKSAVESYEKKNNIKLHSFAFLPFMLWLLKSTAEETAVAAAAAPGVAATVTAATGVTLTATATTVATTTAATTTAVAVGAEVVAKTVAIPLVTKVVAAATAGLIAIGGAGLAISNYLETSAHTHTWAAASCETPKICESCGAVDGEPLGHIWLEAACETPKNCELCGKTEGEALGHQWMDATCQAPQICEHCDATEGVVLAHAYMDEYCTMCGKWEFSEGLTYTLVDGGYEVSGIGTCTDTEISIPRTYEGMPVIRIGNYAFAENSNITSVRIPDGVERIGAGAFSRCTKLKEVFISPSVQEIFTNPFMGCTNLQKIQVAEENQYYSSDDCGVLFNKAQTVLISAPGAISGNYVIPVGVVEISGNAFQGCVDLTQITIPDGVESIGIGAFNECTQLTKVFIPASVQRIESNVFTDCTNLQEINVAEESQYYSSDECGVLFDKEKTVLIGAPGALSGSYAIPEGVEVICTHAFRKCTNLKQITIPDSVVTIDGAAFWECSNLTGIVIPEGVTHIENSTFCYCEGLISVTIPDSVTEIGGYAFYGCSSLQTVALSEDSKLESIGDEAFGGGPLLTEFYIPADVTSIANNAFSTCSTMQRFNVDGNNLYYSSDDRGVLFNKEKTMLIRAPGQLSGSYMIPAGVTTICDEAFWKCSGLTEITIPASVTSMGKYAFCECEGLISVAVPEGVAVIGDHTFMNCSKLASVTIPSSVTLIDQYAFFSCGSLESLTFEGTMAQWAAIEKGVEWKNAVPATEVICTDGNGSLQ